MRYNRTEEEQLRERELNRIQHAERRDQQMEEEKSQVREINRIREAERREQQTEAEKLKESDLNIFNTLTDEITRLLKKRSSAKRQIEYEQLSNEIPLPLKK